MDKGLGGFLENLQTHFLYYENPQTREDFAINPTLLKPLINKDLVRVWLSGVASDFPP